MKNFVFGGGCSSCFHMEGDDAPETDAPTADVPATDVPAAEPTAE